MAPPNHIDAPYNFVPLADWVHLPDWAARVSHDLPFRDGLCGHLDLSLTAQTPILVGREPTAATAQDPGKVQPYRLPDGRYALPGTALKGMLRNVIEIASFSRMNAVDDIRYGLRDISGEHVSAAYTQRVRDHIETGFMQLGPDGRAMVTPCAMVRLSHRTLEEWLEQRPPIFRPERSVQAKYARWQEVCHRRRVDPQRIRFSVEDGQAVQLGSGRLEGVPVFTGQVSDSTRKNGKKRDFVFYDADPASAFVLNANDWGDFLFIHGDQETRDAEQMSWPGYWKQRFWDGEPVPVFYLRKDAKTRVGLAFMPRLAGDFSTHEMIAHTSARHLDGQGKGPRDLAELLFGTVGDQPDACLKGRVAVGHALARAQSQPSATEPTILNGPKASYFPNYLVQDADERTWTLRRGGYATYLSTSDHPEPEVRGWKRYPARARSEVQPLTGEQQNNKRVQVVLHPLPAGTAFGCRVDFHNLLPVELGALCWALTWGGDPRLRHSLGMGKPFGLGQLTIAIDHVAVRPNAADATTLGWPQYRDAFIAHMESAARALNKTWRDSPQVTTLLGTADPENATRFKGALKHMMLETKGSNEFVDAKKAGLVLARYPTTKHPPTWAEEEAERRAEEARLAQEAAEREAQEREHVEKERARAEFDAKPPQEQLIITTKQEIDRFLALDEVHCRDKARREQLIARLNGLGEQASGWQDPAYRQQAADLLETTFGSDKVGWSDPGQKKKQREKKIKNRREMIAKIRANTRPS